MLIIRYKAYAIFTPLIKWIQFSRLFTSMTYDCSPCGGGGNDFLHRFVDPSVISLWHGIVNGVADAAPI